MRVNEDSKHHTDAHAHVPPIDRPTDRCSPYTPLSFIRFECHHHVSNVYFSASHSNVYFDSFAVTVALYAWALAITAAVAIVAATAAAAVPQRQFIQQSFTFHLLDCNKTCLYCMRWSQSSQQHTRFRYLCVHIKTAILSVWRRRCEFIRGTFQRAPISLHFIYVILPFVFVCARSLYDTIGFNCTCYQIYWHNTPTSTAVAARQGVMIHTHKREETISRKKKLHSTKW